MKVDLADGEVRVGGGESDGVRLSGLAPATLTLSIEGERVTLTATETVCLDGVMFPPSVPRLWLPGETVQLPGDVRLTRPAKDDDRKQLGTALVLKDLLSEGQLDETRAASLVCLTGLDAGRRYPLAFNEGVIGRGLDVEVRVRDRAVSRRHARVVRESGRYFVEDLGGPNGVYVGGQPVRTRRELDPGDVIEVGHSMLRFDGPEAPREPPPSCEASPIEPRYDALPEAAPRRRRHLEWLLVGTAAALAITGLLVSVSLTM